MFIRGFIQSRLKKRERRIQTKLSLLQSQGIVCAIEDLDDDDLRRDIREYCGYMDGIGILVMAPYETRGYSL